MSGNGGAGLTEELLSWAGVTIHPHRFGGVEFHFNGKRDRWIEGKASAHHIYPDSGWMSVYLNTEQDVAHAIEITRSKYDQMILRRM